jgi:predicted acyltransferase
MLIAAGLGGNVWLPINKNLWTSTFAMFMAGLDCILFAGFLWLADGRPQLGRVFRPFTIMGMNAIAVYMSSELIDITLQKIPMGGGVNLRVWLYQNLFEPIVRDAPVTSLLYAIAYTLLHLGLAWWLYRRNWFLRV